MRKNIQSSAVETAEFFSYPRQQEGNIYADNWSLTEDGVTPNVSAFRNAKLQTLLTRIGTKAAGNKVELKTAFPVKPKVEVHEAGDSISHDEFQGLFLDTTSKLSDSELFLEDGAVGSFSGSRLGARVVSDNAAIALAARSLLIPTAPQQINRLARAKGWNMDSRNPEACGYFKDDDTFVTVDTRAAPQAGQRPLVVFSAPGDHVTVQFLQYQTEIVGANVIVGQNNGLDGIIKGLGHATSVVVNSSVPDSIAVQSVSFVKGKDTFVVVNGDDAVVDAATKAGVQLYGNYYNILSKNGVAAVFNGSVASSKSELVKSASFTPDRVTVVSGEQTVYPISPNNIAFPAKTLIILDKTGSLKSDNESVVKYFSELVDNEHKAALITEYLASVKVQVVKTAAEAAALLK